MTEGSPKTIKCPQCNRVSELPDNGVDGLITGLALRNLAEKHPEGIKQRKEFMRDDLDREKVETVRTIEELHELERKTDEYIRREEIEIEKAVDAVMTKAQEMIGRIRELKQPEITQIREQLRDLDSQVKTIEATQSKLHYISDAEFVTETVTLVHQIEKIRKTTNGAISKISQDRVVYKVIPAQPGRIIQSRKLALIQEFGEFTFALAIATLSTGSLVISDLEATDPSHYVAVFDNKRGNYEKTLGINVKEATLDVATTVDDKILITREGIAEQGLEMYSSSDGSYLKLIEHEITSKSSKIKAGTASVTTTADGRILAGSAAKEDDGNITGCKVTVYDAAGNILKTVPTSILPDSIADIRGGTMIAIGSFQDNKVCTYDLQSGKKILTLNIEKPLGIMYDEQSDCLLIGRIMAEKDANEGLVPESGVIDQYCCISGTLVARLATGLCEPTGMCLVDNNTIAVTDKNRVKIYRLS